MRRSYRPEWLMDGETFLGVGLGSDACAEHEWGTKVLRAHFGLDESLDGLPRRTITLLPRGLELIEFKTEANSRMKRKALKALAIFYKEPSDYGEKPLFTLKEGELRYYGEDKMSAAWDEKSFGLVAYTEEDQKKLKLLWEAFQRKDVAFWPNVGVFHSGTGLTFAIPSLVPQKHKAEMLEGDLDHKRLKAKSEATGIDSLLTKAGKRWFALSPKWSKELKDVGRGEIKTEHEVLYWLNPMEQDRYNSGWFTVEDLLLWAKNEGPVIKRPS